MDKLIFIPEENRVIGVTTKAGFKQQIKILKEFLNNER